MSDDTPYSPDTAIVDQLRGKTLIMLIGPTAVGKSSLMNEVAKLDQRFKRVSGFTTRPVRANDEIGMYRYLSKAEVTSLIQNRKAVQFIEHPTTDMLYGTEPVDYPGEYNLQDTITTAVSSYRQLPFKSTVTISLTTEPDTWHDWLKIRFPNSSEDRTKRLIEAKQSIEWSLAQSSDHHWLVNQPNDIANTAQQLISVVSHPTVAFATPSQATKLLTLVNHLLSYK